MLLCRYARKSLINSRIKRFFNNWSASCLTKAPLFLIDYKYKANIFKVFLDNQLPGFHYKRIKFHPSRVVHSYKNNNSSSMIKELIIVRHDFQHYEDQENNLLTVLLYINVLVNEYVIKCFKKSTCLSKYKIIYGDNMNVYGKAIGITISKEPDKSVQELSELITIINKLSNSLPNKFEKNIFKMADFSIKDEVLLNFYPMKVKEIYEQPLTLYSPENINNQLVEYNYDQLTKPLYLHKIFKYILKNTSGNLNFKEYMDLKNLIDNNPSIVNTRGPGGLIAHVLGSKVSSYQVFWLLYKGLCKYNSFIQNKQTKEHDWQKIYQTYFEHKTYSVLRQYRIAQEMKKFKDFYLSKLSEYSINISEYEYKHEYPILKDPLTILLPEEKKIMKSLHLDELQRNVDALNKILTEAINNNDLIKFRAILFYIKSLPSRFNGDFVEYILIKHQNLSVQMLEMFLLYYYHAYGNLFPDGPYNNDISLQFVKLLNNYNQQIKAKKLKQSQLLKLHNLPIYKYFIARQQFVSSDNKHDIFLIQKPITLLTSKEKNEMYQLFNCNFELSEQNTEFNKQNYFNKEISRNDENTLELVILFYDNKTKNLISFLTITVQNAYYLPIGSFSLVHARLACNNQNYNGLNLTNIALGKILLTEAIINKHKPTYVFFKSIPPGYALAMMPFYMDFFPKTYMPYHLLKYILSLVGDNIIMNVGVTCRLKVTQNRIPKNLSFPLNFYKATIGEGVKNGMPVIFSMDSNNTKEYFKLLKPHGVTEENLTKDWVPLYLKTKQNNFKLKL